MMETKKEYKEKPTKGISELLGQHRKSRITSIQILKTLKAVLRPKGRLF